MSLNNLYENYPHLREEWDGDIEEMKKYTCGSHTKVNWKCKSGNPCHKWSSAISSRAREKYSSGCPYCCHNPKTCPCSVCPNLYNDHPELRNEWDGDIEDMKRHASNSGKKVNWKCTSGNPCHKWKAPSYNRIKDIGCPYCSIPSRKTCNCINCHNLYNDFPHLRDEWDGDLEEMKKHPSGSNKKVNWKCKSGNPCHKWPSVISNRTGKEPRGCPYCSVPSKKTCRCADCPNLYNDFPHLRNEWVGNVEDMKNYPSGTEKKVNWRCVHGHKWNSAISNRTSKGKTTGCPICVNKTEAILFEYLSSLNYVIEREKKYEWLEDKRRFDFVINNKTIIELDGAQHFRQVWKWRSPESTQDNDMDKMNKALENDFNIIRIHQEDVYYDRIDWRNEIKEAVEYMEDKTGEIKFINETHYRHFGIQENE